MCTGWPRSIGCLVVIGHFPQKSPIISGSLAENDQQLKASCGCSPPCTNYVVSILAELARMVSGHTLRYTLFVVHTRHGTHLLYTKSVQNVATKSGTHSCVAIFLCGTHSCVAIFLCGTHSCVAIFLCGTHSCVAIFLCGTHSLWPHSHILYTHDAH